MVWQAACKWCALGQCWSHGQVQKQPQHWGGSQAAGVKKGNLKKQQEGGVHVSPSQDKQKQREDAKMMQMMMSMGGDAKSAKKALALISGGSKMANLIGGNPSLGDQSKMLLSQWVSTKSGALATKEVILYTTTEVGDTKPPQFVSEVILATVAPDKVYKGKPSASKKAAEASAAAAALRQNGQGSSNKAVVPPKAKAVVPPKAKAADGGGKKRKGEAAEEQCPKSRMIHALALMLGHPATKADMTWAVEQAASMFIGSLTLPGMGKTFTGEPADTKKAAENAAAEAALAALSDEIAAVEEEHQAKKAKKQQESYEASKIKKGLS